MVFQEMQPQEVPEIHQSGDRLIDVEVHDARAPGGQEDALQSEEGRVHPPPHRTPGHR